MNKYKRLMREAQAAAKKAAGIAAKAEADGGRDMTEDERTEYKAAFDLAQEKKAAADVAKKDADDLTLLKSLEDSDGDAPSDDDDDDDDADDADEPGGEPAGKRRKSRGEDAGYGAAFVKSDGFKEFRKKHPSGVGKGTPIHIEAKLGGMKSLFKAPIGSGLDFAQPQRLAPVDLTPPENTGLLDLITRGAMSGNMIEYLQIISVDEGASIVAEATTTDGTTPATGLKPLSTLVTALADAKAFTYADGFDITNQALADDAFTASYIQQRLPSHLRKEVERVLLEGAGTAGEPAGILNTTGTQDQAWDGNLLDTIGSALEKVELADGEPTGIALSVQDAWKLMKLRDDMGRYYSQGPWSSGPGTVWGVPFVKVRRLTPGQGIVGDFRTVALLDREGVSVVAFNQHKDYAQRNLTYVRAELRAAQAIFEPSKLVITDLDAEVEA